MAFERFDKAAAVAVTKPARVTVSTAGVFSLTWRAFEMLGQPEYVEFFFDSERKVIAIAPAEERANGYQVRLPRGGGGASNGRGAVSVRGETFLKYYGIDFSKVWRRMPWIEEKYLCFSVEESDGAERGAADLASEGVE